MNRVRTRIAPSPTGEDLHIGNLYTALLNYAFAKKNGGQFIIRVEDTDRERFIEGSEQTILSSLKKFGLNYDEGPDIGGEFAPYRQSERLELYRKYTKELIDKDSAYYCFCSKEKLEEIKAQEQNSPVKKKHWDFCDNDKILVEKKLSDNEKYVVRLRVPENEDITFEDLIRGKITINTSQIDDQILIKSDGFPTYHLAVVVDDHLMEISHIIRAEEWISSTPKHVLLFKAFGWEMPKLAHVPILRNSDKSKMSKRRNPVWVSWYLKDGYLPEAVLNYLALMGWSHPEQKEIFSLDEFILKLDLTKISPVGPAFDIVKLEWLNGEYIRQMSNEELTQRLEDYLVDHPSKDKIAPIVPLIKERIKKLSDFIPLTDFLFEKPEYDEEVFAKLKINDPKKLLEKSLEVLQSLKDPWETQEFESAFRKLAEENGIKASDMFQFLRAVVSGQLVSPPLFESIMILGKEETLSRFKDLAVSNVLK